MTGPRINPSDLTPFFPPGTGPATPDARATLGRVESGLPDPSSANRRFNTLVHSGYADTLQQVAGPHVFRMDPRSPQFGNPPWGMYDAFNIGKDAQGRGTIVFNPETVASATALSGVAPEDVTNPEHELAQTLGHEVGHTVQTLPGLWPDSVDAYDQYRGEKGFIRPAKPMSLFQQWYQIVGKNQNLTPDNQMGMTHRGWVDSTGNLNRGNKEMFADAFMQAVGALRSTWDPSKLAQHDVRKELLANEKQNPGTMYIMKWLVTQPAFKDHPLGKMLKGGLSDRP